MPFGNNIHHYDDIINLPYRKSKRHTPMAAIDRAAQFSPFAALTGYDAAVKETARLTDKRIEIDESRKSELDEKLQIIREHLGEEVEVAFTYFVPDARKGGGSYCTTVGLVKKLDHYERQIVLRDGRVIPLDEVIEVECNLPSAMTSPN